MSDDGTGAGLEIPSIMIGNHHGKMIKEFLNDATKEEINSIRLKAVFEMYHPANNIVDLKLWYTTAD